MKENRLRLGLTVLLFVTTTVFAFAQNAVIRDFSGTVELKKSGSSEWMPAKKGDVIDKKTIISTSFKSTAILAVGNSTITVRPITRLSLEELITQNETETVSLKLNTGRVKVEVTPPSGGRTNLTVQSPSTTASVRGTVFEFDTTSIRVLEGSVSYASLNSRANLTVIVNADEKSRVNEYTGEIITPADFEDMERSLPGLPGHSGMPVNGRLRFDSASIGMDVDVILR